VSFLKAVSENGYTFFLYKRPQTTANTLQMTRSLHYGYQGQLDLQIDFSLHFITPLLIFAFWMSLGLLALLGLIALPWFASVQREKSQHEKHTLHHQHLEELRYSHQQLEDFAYITAHDLKEPLRNLAKQTHSLNQETGQKRPDSGENTLGKIQAIIQHMESLVDSLWQYAQIGHEPLQREAIPLSALIQNVWTSLSIEFDQTHIELHLPNTLPNIEANPLHIDTLFRNLIKNALQYNDHTEKWIEIGCQTASHSHIFYVRDNGTGIDKSHYHTIFQLFRQTSSAQQPNTSKHAGTGLTMVKRIIEHHQGKLWLDSTLNQGSAFYFTLSPETTPSNWPEAIFSNANDFDD
jgi:light-regulated signal transduction histidine kinase (bacteriophytochrome)